MTNQLILDLTLRLGTPLTLPMGTVARGLIPPQGDPPEGALKDKDGYFIVDKNGKYLVTTEV